MNDSSDIKLVFGLESYSIRLI